MRTPPGAGGRSRDKRRRPRTSICRRRAQTRGARTLDIYVVDVEGGNATLFVAPSGESVLIDAGNPGSRDTDRIVAAARDAGVTKIDHLIVTHYHVDHVGGVGELNALLPIRHFIDHGPSVETNASAPEASQKTYRELVDRGRHTVVKPGDKIPVKGLDVEVMRAEHHGLPPKRPRSLRAARNRCTRTVDSFRPVIMLTSRGV